MEITLCGFCDVDDLTVLVVSMVIRKEGWVCLKMIKVIVRRDRVFGIRMLKQEVLLNCRHKKAR